MALTEQEKRRIFEEEKIRNKMKGKSPLVSVVLSAFLPGLGDWYCGSWFKSIIFLGLDVFCFILIFAAGIGFFLYGPVWICGLVSAWMSANKSETRSMSRLERELSKENS